MAENSGPYPFPSTLHVASSVTLKLSDSNYLLWKTQFESLLRCQKLLGFVNGSTPQPPAVNVANVNYLVVETPNPEYEAWICTDELIKSWIFGTLTEEVLGLVHVLATSQDIWLSLATNFNKSSVAREFDLRRRLQLLNIKGKSFTTYCREFRAVCDNLSSIGKPVDENLKIFTFLWGVNMIPSLQSFKALCHELHHQRLTMSFWRSLALMRNCSRMRMLPMYLLILLSKLREAVILALDRGVGAIIGGEEDIQPVVEDFLNN